MDAIALRSVTKNFGAHTAVDDLSLAVPRGSIYGFIGPNGSGKTTSLRMILGILIPDRGEVEVLGERGERAANDRVGYLPEERGLYRKMRVGRLLRYYGRLKSRSRAELEPQIARWLGRLGLAAWEDKKVETLSKGMAQKVQFIATVISLPEVLILDEPFSGLDPVNVEELKEAVLELRANGTTVVFSTHDMGTAETMCDRIFMIFRGRKVLDGTLEDIQLKYGRDRVRVRTAGGAQALAMIDGVEHVTDHGRVQEVDLRTSPQEFLVRLAQATTVYHFEIARPSLHEIFVDIARPEKERSACD